MLLIVEQHSVSHHDKNKLKKRIDQDGAMRAQSGLKQRVNEPLTDHLQRFMNATDACILFDIPLLAE